MLHVCMPRANAFEQLVQSPCHTKQGCTQFGGLRPFGVSFLFAGWDKNYGFQLYMSDPSGNYAWWKAAVIGANNRAAQSMLKQDYKDDIMKEDAVQLALKVLIAQALFHINLNWLRFSSHLLGM